MKAKAKFKLGVDKLTQEDMTDRLKMPIEQRIEGCAQGSEGIRMDNASGDALLKSMTQYA